MNVVLLASGRTARTYPRPTPASREAATGRTTRDSVRHGRNLLWRVNGVMIPDDAAGIDAGCVLVAAGPREMTFNRVFYRKGNGACEAVIQATLWDPQAQEHTAEVTLVVE